MGICCMTAAATGAIHTNTRAEKSSSRSSVGSILRVRCGNVVLDGWAWNGNIVLSG